VPWCRRNHPAGSCTKIPTSLRQAAGYSSHLTRCQLIRPVLSEASNHSELNTVLTDQLVVSRARRPYTATIIVRYWQRRGSVPASRARRVRRAACFRRVSGYNSMPWSGFSLREGRRLPACGVPGWLGACAAWQIQMRDGWASGRRLHEGLLLREELLATSY
jgi:hypothetical protein